MPLIPLDSEAEIQPVDSTGSGFAVGSIPQQQSQGSFLQPQDRASSQQPARLQPQGQNFLDDPFFVERSVEANKRTLRQMRRQAALIPLGEASPVAEPAPVATPETEYHWEGAAKQAGYGIARTMGANLPSAIGKTFDFINRAEPGDESSLTKIGEENKAQYDLWKKKSVDIQDLNKAIARHTESYLTQAVAQSGETLGALGINAVGTAAGSLVGMPWLGTALSAATFQDLNYEDVYNQAIEKGATPDAAKKAGYINGTIDSILDSLQLKALQSVFKPASKLTNFLWKLGATSLFTEGGLEGVQGVQETIGSEWAAKPKEETAAQFTQRMWDNRSELWQTFKDNAIPAAIMSAGIGVPGHIMGSMSNSQLVKGIKNGLENGKMTTDDVRTLLDSKLKDADESTKRKIEGLISKEKEDVATTEEPPLPEAPPEELIPLDEANVPDLELQPAPALSPQNVGIEIPSPESQTFIEGQPIIPQGVVQPSVNQEQVTSPDVSTQGAGQTPGIESSPVVLPQAGPQEGAPANVPGAQSVTEPLLNVAAPVQEEKTAKSGQAAGELTEDTKINGVTFRQLEDLIINDKPGIKKELEDIKGLHGRAGMQDLVNPGKLYARLRKRLVTEQGMTKDQAKDALQGPFKRYEQRFKEVEGGIENAESVRGNEGQIKTGRDVGQEGQGKGGEDLQLQEPEKASGQEGGINRKAFYSGIEIGKKELDIHRESKTGTETTYRYRPFKYQGAEYLAVQKNMPGARGPEFEVRAPTGHVVQNFKREGAKYNGTFNFAGINTLKDFYHKVSTLAQDDAVNFLDDYHYSQPTPKQSPTVAPEPQAAGGPGGVNQSKVAYYDTVFEEEAKTKYPHHISILNKITREDNFPTVWMTPPYKGKNHLGKVDITQGVIDVHPQMIERLAKKIAKYHDVTVNDVLPELYKEIIQHEQVHIKQQSDMRLPNKRISKNHPLEIEAYEQGNIRKAIDKIIETKKQSAHEESNPIPTNKEALRQKNLEKREAVRAAREKKGEGSIPQQDTTNLKGGVPNAKETEKANAEKEQSREAASGLQVSAQAQKEKIERKARHAQNAPNFRAWIRAKGGLTTPTMRDHGLLDDKAYIGIRNKNGMGIDEMLHMAIDDGWLMPGATEEDFVDAIEKNTKKVTGAENDLLKAHENDYNKYIENLEQEAKDAGLQDRDIEEAERSGVQQADEDFKAASDAEEAELVSIFGKDWDKPQSDKLVLTSEEGTAWDKGDVKDLGPQGKKAVFPTEKIKPAEYKNQGNMFGPQKGETLDLFGQGQTKLNLPDITLNNQTFSDNRKAVGQFRKWMRTAGLSKELLDRLDVEVKNTLKIIGNVRRSEAEHGQKLSELKKAIGSTTFFDDASVLVQFADDMSLIKAEDTAYHEAFHVMLDKLVSKENRVALLDHYKGNEEDAAKAFSKFVVGEETTSIPKPIRKIFYQIKRILTRIGNAFRQSQYKTPEDFFKAIYFGADLKGGRQATGANEFAQSVKMSLDKAVKKITDNPNFVKWFGGSKVVDENGEPLVVYHGSGKANIRAFDPSKAGDILRSDWGKGIYFTPSHWMADSYRKGAVKSLDSSANKAWEEFEKAAKDYGTGVMDMGMDIRSGKITQKQYDGLKEYEGKWRDALKNADRAESGEVYPVYLKMQNPYVYQAVGVTDPFLADYAKDKGHDGIVVVGQHVEGPLMDYAQEIIVFHPTQIKSIYNVGTFDPNNPDIRLQVEAWHGSPHEWAGGKADLSKVGTGEGEQAFGWGAYFTDLEDVAKHYASSLSRVSPGKYREKYGENRVEVYLWAVGEHQKAISNMKERIKSQKEYIKKWGELGESKKALVGMKELLADMEAGDFNPEVPNRNLYKVTLHKSKQPGEYTWLDWRETPSKDIINKVIAQKEKEGGASTHFKNEVKKAGVFPGQGQDLYETLSLLATRGSYSQKGASLLLFRAGIDGIRYPAGMLSGQKTDAKNYVVFDESAVTVEAHTKFNLKPEPRIDYIGDMEDANGNTFGLYNVFGVDGRADGSTVTENTLRKLGLIPEGKRAQTKLNIASTAKEFHAGMATATEDVVGFFKGLSQTKKIRAANKAMRKADTTAFDRYFATPFFSFRKVPAAWRMFEDGQKRDENFHTKVDELSKAGDGQYWTIKLAQAKRQIPEEFKKIWKIFKHLDQNAIGHKVEAGKDKGTFVLKDTKGKEVGVFPSENDAWEAATQRDLEALRKRGLSKQAVNAGEAIIRMRHAGFNLLSKNIREVIAKYEELGMDLPKYSVWQDGEKIVVDLKMELARLGDLRGYYMPHSWKPGRIIVYARREGAHGVIKKFDTEIMAANWERDMQGKGYKTESKISGPMPEDVFDMAGQTVAVNAMLNESLERLKKKDFTLAEFDLKGEFVKATGKNKDFRLIGPTNKRQGQILKDMGGKWYQAKRDNVEHWHFMNKPPTFEKKLTKALALSSISGEVDKQTAMLFAGGLAEQLGNIIKERGARKHMIHRSGAKGVEVWEGYEEDPDLAMAQYVRSLAAGEAKHVMAVDMVKHMTGTDISWKEYKAMIEDEQDKTPEYEEYLDFVKDRGIDAIGQPHIFKDASAYMKDMLRNQEASDRVIGIVKGLAVLKYLGFKLSALPINMSAMLTTVPASMKAYGDISIGKAFGHMARMSKMYVQYERYKRSNDASLLPQKYIDLFQEMEKKGYGKPQFNRETLATLESKMGRGYSRLIELSMTPFAISETFNRMVTISAAYEGLRAQGKSHEEALKIAKDVSDHAHAIYGKGNYPHILRGENLASQVLKCGYVFKQFNHNYLQAMWDMGYNKHDAKATMWMAASPIFLSGMGAFAGTALIKAALQALGADDPEEWFYNQVEENLGQKAGTVARVGLPGLVGVSLKGSLAIDLTGIPTKPAEFLGAPGSVIGDFWEGGKQLFKGNTSKGVEKLLPTVLASPVKAVREYTEGVTSSGNLPVYYGSKPLAPDMAESITRFLGFSPARIASAREKQWNERLIEQKYTERRSGIYARFHKYFLMPPEARSKAKYLDLLAEVSQYNNDLIKSGLTKKGYSPITPKLLRANIKRGFRPSKKEKLREER